MKKVLVTGSAGFIGSAFVRWLLRDDRDIEVISYDKLTYSGNLENLKTVEGDPRHRFVRGCIADEAAVKEAMRGVDTVVHFAAETHVDRSVLDPAVFVRTNVLGTNVLLEAARQAEVERFHHISTDEVYGDLGLDEPRQFREGDAYAPRSPYAASKASSDHLVMAYHHTFGLPVTISNCVNNYGPYQFPEKLIPLFSTNAMEDKPLPLYRSSLNRREYIHADDHSAAVELIIEKAPVGEQYNIGTGIEKSVEDITDIILGITGKPASLKTYVPDRPGHDRRYAVDSGKLRRELGWQPAVDFEEGMRQTIEWYINNRPWWERVKDGSYQEYYDRYYNRTLAGAA